jgi:tetratricopeptide (TPR) repeat protein
VAWDQTSLLELERAADRFDRPRVDAMCDELTAALRSGATILTDGATEGVLRLLRSGRYFRSLQRVADALIQNGHDTPRNRRLYAQALVDQDALTGALSVLAQILARCDDPAETGEAMGLVGRVYKQLYVTSRGGPSARLKDRLTRAVAAYHDAYSVDAERNLWHGVNAVALLARAEADGIALQRFPRPAETATSLAERIVAAVESDAEADVWRPAAALEACLALGRYQEARSWLERYVRTPGTDAFELGGTLRQLVQVWRLDSATEPGASLLPLLKAELLSREGGRVTITSPELSGRSFARLDSESRRCELLSGKGFTSFESLERGLQRCRSVARIEDRFGDGIGTGFLVDGRAFRSEWPDVVLVTNAHVVPGTLNPEDGFATFRGTGAADARHALVSVLWTSGSEALDVTILRLDSSPPQVSPSVLASSIRAVDTTPPPRAFVIGHPEGTDQPMFSLENNRLLDFDDHLVHYSAATLHGSSGSPVYDDSWELIALHHAGGDTTRRLHQRGGTYRANEGISLRRILEAVGERPA